MQCLFSGSISNFDFHSHVKSDKLDEESKVSYKSDLGALLIIPIDRDGLTSQESLNKQYAHIVDCITRGAETLPKTKFKPFLKPYWDNVLKNLHAVMREKRRK